MSGAPRLSVVIPSRWGGRFDSHADSLIATEGFELEIIVAGECRPAGEG